MLTERFAANLKRLRTKQGITQEGLAAAVPCSVSYVSLLERVQRSPSLETIEATAAALGVDPLALLKG